MKVKYKGKVIFEGSSAQAKTVEECIRGEGEIFVEVGACSRTSNFDEAVHKWLEDWFVGGGNYVEDDDGNPMPIDEVGGCSFMCTSGGVPAYLKPSDLEKLESFYDLRW